MKIRKVAISFVVLVLVSMSSFAQFAGNSDIVIPTKSSNKMSIGASGTYLYDVNGAIAIGANAGFRVLLQENVKSFQIPIMADFRYYVNSDNYGFYPEALLGFVITHTTLTIFGSNISSNTTNFAFAIGAGYKIDDSIDISARFEGIVVSNGSANSIGIRIGYWF